jgi:sugar phosphate isomerase/epimerase
MKKIILGAHSLSAMFTVKNYVRLQNAMRATAARGGTLFEIPYLLCKLSWEKVAQAARYAGIKEIALCHFWPMNPDGTSVCGDPLGSVEEVKRALSTLNAITVAVRILRGNGIVVRFIDGPTWGGLGWDYHSLSLEEKHLRVISFLKQAGTICEAAQLTLAVEFLRPGEDKVIGRTRAMIKILEEVDHPAVGMHFDVFHSIECGENPADMIREAKGWIVYLHLHGDKRRAPGAPGEQQDWTAIIQAIKEIDSGVDDIPGVPEPFGEATCKENAALGEGLPLPPPLTAYLDLAYQTLRSGGLPV